MGVAEVAHGPGAVKWSPLEFRHSFLLWSHCVHSLPHMRTVTEDVTQDLPILLREEPYAIVTSGSRVLPRSSKNTFDMV